MFSNFFKSWSLRDYIISFVILITIIITTSLSFTNIDNNEKWYWILISSISAVFSVVSVILASKKNYFSFLFGVIGSIFYFTLSIYYQTYLTALLQIIFVIPISLLSFRSWKSESNIDYTIKPKKSDYTDLIFFLSIGLLITVPLFFIYNFSLSNQNETSGIIIWLDVFNFVFTIIAFYFSYKRNESTWIVWIIVNLVSLGLYLTITIDSNNFTSSSIIIMSNQVAYLINAIWGYTEWHIKKN